MVNLAFRQSFFTVKNVDGAYIGLHCLLRRVLLGHLAVSCGSVLAGSSESEPPLITFLRTGPQTNLRMARIADLRGLVRRNANPSGAR
jgi:hypothetical protein